jgi:hypothetical protein
MNRLREIDLTVLGQDGNVRDDKRKNDSGEDARDEPANDHFRGDDQGTRGELFKGFHGRFLCSEHLCLVAPAAGKVHRPAPSTNRMQFGMYVGQHLRDKIAPETFRTLVLIAVIAAGGDLLRQGFAD